MSLWTRVKLLFRMKASSALDQAESVPEVFDYAYSQQQEMLRKVRLGLVEVATAKRQLEQQVEKLHERVPRLEDQARRALGADREDLARIALQRKQTALAELDTLQVQLKDVAEEERKLTLAEQQMAARIEDFRTRRTATLARYSAAEAQEQAGQSIAGISGELAELNMALGRAEEKTDRLQARASAIDTLIESGSLALPSLDGDVVEKQLREITMGKAVEADLASLKSEVSQKTIPAEAGSASSTK